MAENRLNNANYRAALEEGSKPPGLSLADIVGAMLQAEFLVPLDGLPTDGQISPRLFQGNGEVVLLAFTDRETARALLPDDSVPAVALPGTVLCRLAAQMIAAGAPLGGLIIDPSGPIPFPLSAEQIQEVVTGGMPGEGPAATLGEVDPQDILYAGPPAPPWGEPLAPSLLDSLRRAVADAGAREAYWLLLVQTQGRRDIVLGVTPADPELMDSLWRAVDQIWKDQGPQDCSVALSELAGDWGAVMREQGERL